MRGVGGVAEGYEYLREMMRNILKLIVMIAQLCEHTKNYELLFVLYHYALMRSLGL